MQGFAKRRWFALAVGVPLVLLFLPSVVAEEVKITNAVFCKSVNDRDEPVSPGAEFEPTDHVVLKASLNSRPAQGTLSCRFSLGKQEITVVSVDLESIKGTKSLPANMNAYSIFTLKPIEPFPVSSDYRAEVFYDDMSLGTFRFSVVEPKRPVPHASVDDPRVPAESATHAAAEALKTREIVSRLLQGTAFVEGVDENGKVWRGTAWLLDKQRRLLVTNDHVANAGAHDSSIGKVKKLSLYFPAYRDGRVIHEATYYSKHATPINAKIVIGDAETDLALLQADTLPSDGLKALTLTDTSVSLGDSLHSLGGIPAGSEGFWIYTSGEVRAVYKRSLASGYLAETVEADMQTNQGNSGGPVVNSRGELVAVVEGHSKTARSVSLYIDVTEVRTFLSEALPLVAPKTVEQFTQRGEHHFDAGRLDEAISDFTQVLRIDPNNAYAMSSRGWAFYEKGDSTTAITEFNDAILADKTMLYAYRGRAMVELDAEQFDKAVEDLTYAIKNSTDQEELAEFYNERGAARSHQEQYEPALGDFDRAIKSNPEYAWAHGNRGNMLMKLGQIDESLLSFRTAIELDSGEAEFQWLMGQAAHLAGNHEGALTMFELAIQTDASQPDYLIDRARCLIELERLEDAGKSLLAAIEIDSDDDRIRNEVGLVAFELGNFSLAYSQFRTATELVPGEPMYWFNRGHSAFKEHEYSVAVTDLNHAAKLSDDADIFMVRGNAYSMLDRATDANADFSKARSLRPKVFQKYKTKYLQIANRTNEPVHVSVRYYTKGTDGQSRWYPRSGEPLMFEFAPGEVSGLNDDGRLIHGAKFHVWAEGLNTGKAHLNYKDNELVFVGKAGYLTDAGETETELFNFVETP